MVSYEERYSPVKTLCDHNISSVIWGEDALRHFGVKTMLFKLYLLVPNPLAAAQALISSGQYVRAPSVNSLDFLADTDLNGRAIRVSPTSRAPNIGTDEVVLLDAARWCKYPLPRLSSAPPKGDDWMFYHFPTFPLFMQHLLTTWLVSPWTDGQLGQTWFDVSTWVSYIYGARLPELTYPVDLRKASTQTGRENAEEFAKHLGPGARELHIAMSKGVINCLGAPDWKTYHKILIDSYKK